MEFSTHGIKMFFISLVLLMGFIKSLQGQEIGLPPYEYYSPQDYNAGNRNWSIVSDSLGIIYVANSEGILIFDGIHWDKVELPENHTAYWIEKDKKGNIYVGANGEFGELIRNKNGLFEYQSLLPKLDRKFLNFNVVWEIAQSGEDIVFRSRKYIFHYDRKTIKVFDVPSGGTAFDVAYSVNDTVYTRIYDFGLAYVDHLGIHKLPNSEFFAKKKVNGIYHYGDNQLLIATRKEGLFLYHEQTGVSPFKTDIDNYLIENRIYDGHHLQDGNYALATMADGVIIITPNGHEKFRFDSSNGLGNNQSLYLREANNQLWLGTKNGIVQMAYNAPYRKVEKEFGLNGQVTSIKRKGTQTYVTCNDGVYQLTDIENQAMFKPVNDHVIVDCISTFEYQDTLYFSSLEGIFKYSQGQTENISGFSPRNIISTDHEGVFIASEFYYGLLLLQFDNNQLTGQKISGINRFVSQIVKKSKDKFWVKTIDNVLYEISIKFDVNNKPNAGITNIIDLPENTFMVKFNDQILFLKKKQVFKLERQQLVLLSNQLAFQYEPTKIINITQVNENECFICYEDEFNSYYCEKFKINSSEEIVSTQRFIHSFFKPEVVFEDPIKNEIWLGGAEGLNIYNSFDRDKANQQQTLIRRITINNDSIINNFDRVRPILSHDQNNIKISFIANKSLNSGKVLYQYKLGVNSTWSNWAEEKNTVLSALQPGEYLFQVRSISPYKGITETSSLSFTILKPWYLTQIAYLCYILISISIIYLVYRIRVNSLYNKQEELAKIVTQTTGQLAKANALLNEKADRLEKLGEFKSRFFSNISHDLRTPIMLLSGRVDLLKSDENSYLSEKATTYVNKLEEDAKRLVILTDEIKELIKLEEGKITLNLQSIDINIFLGRIIGLFESAAESRSITLNLQSDIEKNNRITADPHYLERIMYNLISNAIKFTNINGEIKISIQEVHDQLVISVGDNGIGISASDLTEVFERSFQANNQHQGSEGLGIGLNVVRELVHLHHGKIWVESKLDEGTQFTLSIPSNKNMVVDPYEELSVGSYITDRQATASEITKVHPLVQLSSEKEKKNQKNRLLLVEDNPEVRDYILDLLKDEYKIYIAPHGKEAITILKQVKVDVIVTDLMMPVMDGFEFIKGIKQIPKLKDIPVLVVSARDSKEDRYQIMQLGVNNILAKPFDRKEFSLKIKNLIEESNASFTLSSIVNQLEDQQEEQIIQLNKLIIDHIDNPQFKVSHMADQFHLSERSFFRLVKNLTGKSPLEYIKDFKFSYALDLLKQNKVQTIKEVAFAIGMKNATDFNKQFEKRFKIKAQVLLKQGQA